MEKKLWEVIANQCAPVLADVKPSNLLILTSEEEEVFLQMEELPYIWDRYYRGKKPHKRAAVGTGLGLNIARSILDGYGMDYGAESTVGKGSTFWFEMEEAPAEKQ